MTESKNFFLIFINAIIIAIILSFPIMWLWNDIAPIFKLPILTYLQTVKLFTLIDLLFKQSFKIRIK